MCQNTATRPDLRSPISRFRDMMAEYVKNNDYNPPTEAELELAGMLLSVNRVDTSDHSGGSYTTFLVFQNTPNDDTLIECLALHGIECGERRCGHEHDCCGCYFGGPVRFDTYNPEAEYRVGTISRSQNV